MTEITTTIAPIFIIIMLGAGLRRLGFLPDSFVEKANRLVFYVAIPAMIFRAIAHASFLTDFKAGLVAATLAPPALLALLGLWFIKFIKTERRSSLSFLQSTFHGNLGYVGLAVAFYYLGETGLRRASILAGFLMLLQNLLAVVVLSDKDYDHSGKPGHRHGQWIGKLVVHPVVVSAMIGMGYSVSGLPLPVIAERSLSILGGMALPTALLLIGASISWQQLHRQWKIALGASLLKLLLVPTLGLIGYRMLGYTADMYTPGLILLGAPTATVVYIMARQMNGNPELASSCISVSTLVSAVTYTLWLSLAL